MAKTTGISRPGGPAPRLSPLRWLGTAEGSVVIVLAALRLYMAVSGGSAGMAQFAGGYNLANLARSISLQSIFAVGVLLVILTGGIDLSLGSLIAFVGMLLAVIMTRLADSGTPVHQATLIGIGAVLFFSLGLGLVHAVLIHHLRLPSFVVTLASMSILRSGAQLLNNAVPIPIERFQLVSWLGNGKVGFLLVPPVIPVALVVMLALAGAVALVLARTQVGRAVFAVGSNEEAARLSGLNVFRVRAFVYGACSLLGGIAGIFYAGYGNQGDPSGGIMFELNAISAAVIGGAALTGGRGSVLGTVLGATLLESILSAINFKLSNPTLWRGTVVGTVLLLAVVLNQLRLLSPFRRRAGA